MACYRFVIAPLNQMSPNLANAVQAHVEVPKRGPRNRTEPAGLAILSFETEEEMTAAEQKWRDKVVGGRPLQLSRTGFPAEPHDMLSANDSSIS